MNYAPPIKSRYIQKSKAPQIIQPDFSGGINQIISLIQELNTLKIEVYRSQKDVLTKQKLVDEKLAAAQSAIEQIKNIRQGDRGAQGVPGKDATVDHEYIINEVTKKIPVSKIDYEKIIKEVVTKIPRAKPGKDALVDYGFIISEVSKKIPNQETAPTDPMAIIDQILSLPKGKGLSINHIDGLEQTIAAFRNQLARGYLHGGGDTIKAGTNVTITVDANGKKVISASGGGSSTGSIIAATNTGDNKNYTLAQSATSATFYVIINNGFYTVDDPSFGFAVSGTTLTFATVLPSDLANTTIKLVCL